jgi:hypothetical protein
VATIKANANRKRDRHWGNREPWAKWQDTEGIRASSLLSPGRLPPFDQSGKIRDESAVPVGNPDASPAWRMGKAAEMPERHLVVTSSSGRRGRRRSRGRLNVHQFPEFE